MSEARDDASETFDACDLLGAMELEWAAAALPAAKAFAGLGENSNPFEVLAALRGGPSATDA